MQKEDKTEQFIILTITRKTKEHHYISCLNNCYD